MTDLTGLVNPEDFYFLCGLMGLFAGTIIAWCICDI